LSKAIELLDLYRELFSANSKDEFGQTLVNKTSEIIEYDNALYWHLSNGFVSFDAVSGNQIIDKNGPYALKLKNWVKSNTAKDKVVYVKDDNINHAILYFQDLDSDTQYGLILQRKSEFQKAEKFLLDELSVMATHGAQYHNLKQAQKTGLITRFIPKQRKAIYIAIILLLLAMFPVRETVTAQAEIIADSPIILTAPIDGIIQDLTVNPGDEVRNNDILGRMDYLRLEADLNIMQQQLGALQDKRAALSRSAIADTNKKSELQSLQNDIESKKIDIRYAEQQLERSFIRAKSDGTVIFSDKNSLIGRPIQTGDKIMEIANPDTIKIQIRIPPQSMIDIDKTDNIFVFMDAQPFKTYEAAITSIGYQATADYDGFLSYKVNAIFAEKPKDARIGWKGTAKIKGDHVMLIYSIMRKPIILFRNLTGI
jgi:multidrug resistance efflux pump